MTSKRFLIENMNCQHCVMAVKKELSKLDLVSYEVEIGSAKVDFDESKTSNEQIEIAIENAGYKVRKG
ncbi:MAG: heavy-metal-associated domain-containing protein [Melioribacteraceae bacterium]|jgi:copper chaperone|nr:heavy-metal-associated domain-containing protein [Melioribacteraceae bacterium]